jgi:Cu-Zn family superoxide dismutase
MRGAPRAVRGRRCSDAVTSAEQFLSLRNILMRHDAPMRGHTGNDLYQTKFSNMRPGRQVPARGSMRRRRTLALVTVVVAFMPISCAYHGLTMAAVTAATLHGDGTIKASTSTHNETTASATTTKAETYNPTLAPVGARLKAALTPSGESTNAEFTVSGLLPNRGYSVHADVNACGGFPNAEGPHYQNRIDPAATARAPSTNPEYANPNNEIWLDLRTDAAGSGTSRTTVPFVFTDRGPGSIVVYEATQTDTGPGQAGKAGAPIACLTLSAVQPQGVEPRGSR